MKIKFPFILVGTLFILLSAHTSMADEAAVNFSGELFIPPCRINNGTDIKVDWSSVDVTQVPVKSVGSTQKFDIPLTCTYATGTMVATWTPSTPLGPIKGSIETAEYATNKVYVFLEYATGTAVPFNLPEQGIPKADIEGTAPDLTIHMIAGLGREGSGTEAAGKFSATSTLAIIYK